MTASLLRCARRVGGRRCSSHAGHAWPCTLPPRFPDDVRAVARRCAALRAQLVDLVAERPELAELPEVREALADDAPGRATVRGT